MMTELETHLLNAFEALQQQSEKQQRECMTLSKSLGTMFKQSSQENTVLKEHVTHLSEQVRRLSNQLRQLEKQLATK